MIRWVGFKSVKIDVQHAEREIGTTSYNFKRLLYLAMDIILAYSDKPIRLTIKLGVLISLFSLIMAVITLIQYLLGQIIIPGYARSIISIWFLSGLLIMTLGVVGLYVGKTFESVKRRPIYIIDYEHNC